MNAGTDLLPHATASKNQNVFSVRAAVGESMQWLAENRYGALLDSESLSSVPVQRYVNPSSCVCSVAATAFVLSTNACVLGVTQATSMLQDPANPISTTALASSLVSD